MARLPRRFWFDALTHAGLLLAAASIVATVTLVYVASERDFYYGDYSRTHNIAIAKAIQFREHPRWALTGAVWRSLSQWYSDIPGLPLLPLLLAFGDSRLVAILGMALLYQLPFAIVLGALGTQVIPAPRGWVLWSTVALATATPMVWAPTLRGYPDVGSLAFIALGILGYVRDSTLRRWWQAPFIGSCLAVAILFRRPYAYSVVAFFVAAALQAGVVFALGVREDRRRALREVFQTARGLVLVGACSAITLALLGWPFVNQALTVDFRHLFASFAFPISQAASFPIVTYGWVSWVLAAIGYAVGISTGYLRRRVATFVVLFTVCSLAQWVLLLGYNAIPYTIQFAPFIVLGMSAMGWMAAHLRRTWARLLAISSLAGYVIANAVMGLAPVQVPKGIGVFFSASHPPFVRQDYDEIARLVVYLRGTAAQAPVYVAAASHHLTEQLLENAEWALYGRPGSVLRLLRTAAVNSSAPYPLEALLRAQYVVVATPWQPQERVGAKAWEYHLPAQEQTVVKVVVTAFEDNWEIARDFGQRADQFVLANGAVVKVYERKSRTSVETAIRTLAAMHRFLGLRPGGQPDWIVLENGSDSVVAHNGVGAYSIDTRFRSPNDIPRTTLLYIGPVPDAAILQGTLRLRDSQCAEVVVRLTPTSATQVLNHTASMTRRYSDAPDLRLYLRRENAAYLLLSISREAEAELTSPCRISLREVAVANGWVPKVAKRATGVRTGPGT